MSKHKKIIWLQSMLAILKNVNIDAWCTLLREGNPVFVSIPDGVPRSIMLDELELVGRALDHFLGLPGGTTGLTFRERRHELEVSVQSSQYCQPFQPWGSSEDLVLRSPAALAYADCNMIFDAGEYAQKQARQNVFLERIESVFTPKMVEALCVNKNFIMHNNLAYFRIHLPPDFGQFIADAQYAADENSEDKIPYIRPTRYLEVYAAHILGLWAFGANGGLNFKYDEAGTPGLTWS